MLKIIAEVGINHNGNFDYIYELIRQASFGGANAVKFQLYTSKLLFGDESRKEYEFTYNEVKQIKSICDLFGIEFFASVFDEEKFDWCEDLNVKTYKIASRTLARDKHLCKKIFDTGKRVYASLGMVKDEFIYCEVENVSLFRCIPKYPTSHFDLKDHDLFKFDDIFIVGWSDHSFGISTCLYAISKGASVIEKHFTLDKSMGPHHDHIGSMDLEELKILNSYGRELHSITTEIKKRD